MAIDHVLYCKYYGCHIYPSLPSAAFMCQWIRSALVQIMACRLFVSKPLSKAVLGYCPTPQQSLIYIPAYTITYLFHYALSSVFYLFHYASLSVFYCYWCEYFAMTTQGFWNYWNSDHNGSYDILEWWRVIILSESVHAYFFVLLCTIIAPCYI